MTCQAELTNWAEDILNSLAETGISKNSVVTWLNSNLGPLNIRLKTDFQITGGCVSPDMSQQVSGIYNEMYYCYYYGRKVSENLGAAGYDWTEIRGEEQGSMRKVSRNEVSKIYRGMQNDCHTRLDKLSTWYLSASNPNAPLQILYNTRSGTADSGLGCPPQGYYAPYNTVWMALD